MKVVIRADAYSELGTGHVMRCIALGQGIKEKGNEVVFIAYCSSEGLVSRLKSEGFSLHLLNEPGSFIESVRLIEQEKPDWVVLDGYHFDSEFQKAVKDAGHRLLYIDDYAHLERYYADIILNQNYGAEKFHYNAEPDTKILAGTEYVLLRREFMDYATFKRDIPDVAHKVLITLGGADPDNHTLKILHAINLLDIPLNVKIVIGASSIHYESVRLLAEKSKHTVKVLRAVENMASLLAWADLAISAGGTTIWELALMGTPSIVGIVAENQESSVNALSGDGIIQSLGWLKDQTPAGIAHALSSCLTDRSRREEMKNKMCALADGKGLQRILHAMDEIPLDAKSLAAKLRRDISFDNVVFKNFINLTDEEKEIVRQWRNSDEIRKWMFSQHLISREEHLNFIESLNYRDIDFHWMVIIEGVAVGVINFRRIDIAQKSGYFGIYSIKKGSGSIMLAKLFNLWFEVLQMHSLKSELKSDNVVAHKLYKKFGFIDLMSADGPSADIISMELTCDTWNNCISKEERLPIATVLESNA